MTHKIIELNGNTLKVFEDGKVLVKRYNSDEYYEKNPRNMTVEVFYHNNKKLSKWKGYKAELVCHVCQVWGNSGIWDVSIMRFHPDWDNPVYAPIAVCAILTP